MDPTPHWTPSLEQINNAGPNDAKVNNINPTLPSADRMFGARVNGSQLVMWNLAGTNRSEAFSKLLKSHPNMCICGFVETWSLDTNYNPPNPSFCSFNNSARKVKMKGRPSGGISVIILKSLKPKLCFKSDCCIIVKCIMSDGEVMNTVITYIPPTECFATTITDMFVDIRKYTDDNLPLFILGDLNSRISTFQIPIPDDGQNWFNNVNLARKTTDITTNTRGNLLIKMLRKYTLIVLNGTSKEDASGQLTYTSHLGKSLIDLALTNLAGLTWVNGFNVLPFTESDHFPVSLSIKYSSTTPTSHKQITISKWDYSINKEKLNNLCETFRPILNANARNSLLETLLNELETVLKKVGIIKTINLPQYIHHKPWANTDTKLTKKEMKKKLRQFKNEPTTTKLNVYISAKRLYQKTIKLAKLNYWNDTTWAISKAKSSTEFWNLLRKFKYMKPKCDHIEKEIWNLYLKELQRKEHDILFTLPYLERKLVELDSDITEKELMATIKKSRGKTAPGTDNIPINIWKTNVTLITNCFLNSLNIALNHHIFPAQWSKVKQFPIFKHGDPTMPTNYRFISILNSSYKIFTSILNSRLSAWAENHDIIPQEQFAFRPTRGTDEPIFILSMIIQKQLSKNADLHVIFIDLSKAFDSVGHQRLWNKLYSLGLSKNFVELLRKLYENLFIYFAELDPIKINKGVLQGDCLSPTLFNLFLADFKIPQDYGIPLGDNSTTLTHLMFADDIILLADNQLYLRKSLTATVNYMKDNGLDINLTKTKYMVFSKHARRTQRPLFLEGKLMDRVNTFKYLGVEFQANHKWKKTINNKVNETIKSFHLIWAPLYRMKFANLNLAFKLFDLQILPKLLYGSHIWGMDNAEIIERVQTTFIKKMMYLPSQTAGYALRLEFNRYPIQVKIFKRAIKFWSKVVKMDSKRLTCICLNEALQKHTIRLNPWLKDFETRLHTIGLSLVMAYNEAFNNQIDCNQWIMKYRDQLKRDDIQRMKNTHTYNGLQYNNYDINSDYLFNQGNIKLKRMILRLRLESKNIYIGDNKLVIDPINPCQWCNSDEVEDWSHVFYRCEYLKDIRSNDWLKLTLGAPKQMIQTLNMLRPAQMYEIYTFLQKIILTRNQWKQ